ncbi:DNA damage-inducible protein D [Agriterribacter sp.]|uniref:DNA damage-inducible protein D n=1 Tax=Agriterribacter sp. TaxID=2821509 RepID=UPI002C9E2BC0|nr:DNA damage-inducible protein D [Agriterribacter sp.]HRO44985.1 DNA damage-inducible protein D [Agriterribacter sp.]HRQ15722.1 DNA damage-inducible protein D [Agriterribacter sp.]
MKKEQIAALFQQFEQAAYHYKDIECWSARELQEVLGYTKWDNFLKVIEKARAACESSGVAASDHFAGTGKMIELAKGAQREIDDIALTRYACYLVAQNGDSSKPSVAFAQTYFAVQTRKQEIIEQRLLEVDRVTAREKLTKSEKKLSGILFERGVDSAGFAIIKSKGDQALFGGFTTADMKRRLGVPATKPLADFLPTLTIKAKDFANELTTHNVTEKDLRGDQQIGKEHTDNNKAVRDILLQRGVKPESLPPDEDVKKVERRLESDEKKIAKAIKKDKQQ